mgnify:CR=1 FL=1
MKTETANKLKLSIGDLVWIPANTPLMFYQSNLEPEWSFRSTEKKEPVYGLVVSDEDKSFKVLIGKEEYYVRKNEVYGV